MFSIDDHANALLARPRFEHPVDALQLVLSQGPPIVPLEGLQRLEVGGLAVGRCGELRMDRARLRVRSGVEERGCECV